MELVEDDEIYLSEKLPFFRQCLAMAALATFPHLQERALIARRRETASGPPWCCLRGGGGCGGNPPHRLTTNFFVSAIRLPPFIVVFQNDLSIFDQRSLDDYMSGYDTTSDVESGVVRH